MMEWVESETLRTHMECVAACMNSYCTGDAEERDRSIVTGLLHDFDYERYPNEALSPTEQHPAQGVALLRETGYPEELCTAILGHAHYTEGPRETPVAKALFAVDELCGFLIACALVRPSRSLMDLTVKSVKKKLKDTAVNHFASGWAWLVKKSDGSLDVTSTENGVNPLCFGQTALLGCDVWEHSYYIDFRNARPKYLSNFLDNLVNWENVASRM